MTETFKNGYAVLISVDQNKTGDLAFEMLAKDVAALHDVLVHPKRCGYEPENVYLVQGKNSTKENILKALKWLKDKVDADPGATAVVYYTGHGYRDRRTGRYFLVPYDISSLLRLSIDGLAAEKLQEAIQAIQAQRTLVILDCCHAAGMGAKEVLPEMDDLEIASFPDNQDVPLYELGKAVQQLAQGAGRAILNSSKDEEKSYVRPDRTMSIFTYHMIEALTGHARQEDKDDMVEVGEVISWVKSKVAESADRMWEKPQNPVIRANGDFPVAMLLGGAGLNISAGEKAPSPLELLPEGGVRAVFNQEGQTMLGNQVNAGQIQGGVTFGDTIYVGGGDVIQIHEISGGVVAIGRNAQAIQNVYHGRPLFTPDLSQVFAPLIESARTAAPGTENAVRGLQNELERGREADDEKMSGFIRDIFRGAPALAGQLATALAEPQVVGIIAGKSKTELAVSFLP